MITYLLTQLVILWYKCFPKYYFSKPPKTDAHIYWVDLITGDWGRVKFKEVTRKKYIWFGEETKKMKAVYEVNSYLFYSISDKHARDKAPKIKEKFKYLLLDV